MLKIERKKKQFTKLDTMALSDASISERYDLQQFILFSPEEFFSEIGQQLFLIGDELQPSETVQDRIDILALDKEGAAVIIEIKRGTHKLHLLQAISYAGMVAKWEPEDFVQLLDDDQSEALLEFPEVDKDEINRNQKILLIAEGYDYSVLAGAEWLSDGHGVDITCCRILLTKDSKTGEEYAAVNIVFPAPELTQHAVPRGKGVKAKRSPQWPDWETALKAITNEAVKSYFEKQIHEDRENYLRKRHLHYRINAKRRWTISARKDRAYAWQHGRFENDVELWRDCLSKAEEVAPVKNNTRLRFKLYTKEDFRNFHREATEGLHNVEWEEKAPEYSDEDENRDDNH